MQVPNEKNSDTKPNSKLTRRERKLQRTRSEILAAAKKLFTESLYEDVKMDDIAEHADLSRATLYNHFVNKEAIYFDIGIQSLRELCKRQKSRIKDDHPGIKQIEMLTEDLLSIFFEQPLIHEITRRYLVMNVQADIPAHIILQKMESGEKIENSSDIILANYLKEMRVFEKTWKDAIIRGFEDGTILHKLNAEQLTHFLFMIILGIMDRIQLEKLMLEKVDLTKERLKSTTIELIRKDLSVGK